MSARIGVLFAVLVAACASASREGATPDRAGALVELSALPRLRVHSRPPLVDADRFRAEGRAWKLPIPAGRSQGPVHATDTDAVAAATAWLLVHFGSLPSETELVATRISHSAAGSDDAESRASHSGHTIVLQQTWRGFETAVCSVVYLGGKVDIGGHFELAAFEPVAGTETPVITAQAAVDAVVAWMRASGGVDDAKLDAFRQRAQPRLVFVYSSLRDEDLDLDPLYFEPNWDFGDGLMVDAREGIVWRNC